MAARTSAQAGNWSASATWTGGTIPGNGDTATITHNVVADVNQIVGASPAGGSGGSGTPAVTVNTGGKLTLASGITFTCRGDIRMNATTLQMNAGSTFKFDASQATTPLSQHYWMYFSSSASSILTVTGLAGSRCTITSDAAGGSGAITKVVGDVWHPTVRYCDISRLGQASVPAIEMGGGYSTFDFEQVVFDTCGQLALSYLGAASTVRLVNVTMKNTLSTLAVDNTGTPVALTSGTRLIQGCVFDKVVQNTWLDWTVTDTVFTGGVSLLGANPWASFSGNLLEWNTNYDQQVRGDVVNCFCLASHTAANPHFIQVELTGAVRGCIFESAGTFNDGDCVMPGTPASPVTITVEHCLALPNGGGGHTGTMTSLLGNANVTLIARHNTWFLGGQSAINIGETYLGHANMVAQYRDNLCWDTTARNYKMNNVAATAVDQAPAANLHHNAGYFVLPGSNLKGYNGLLLSTGSPGASDVDGVDPLFVDRTRDFAAWDGSIAGGAGTIAHGLAELKKKNDPTYNSAYTIAALVTWVKAGFVPQAPAYQAASDSVAPSNGWIGALAGVVTAITSAAAGNWNVGATWVGGVVPANGTSAIVNHVVTVTANQTVGTSPAAGTNAVTVNAPGGLVIAPGVTLTCRGDLTVTSATVTGGAGSKIEFDATAAAAPSTTKYRLALEGTAAPAGAFELLGIG